MSPGPCPQSLFLSPCLQIEASDFSSMATPSKSKKPLNLTSELQSEPVLDTPKKLSSRVLPNRARNRGVALSIKEIRKVAQTRPKRPMKGITSARKQILSFPAESPPPKVAGNSAPKLPEKYEILCDFFYSLDSAIRLLKLKRQMPTFTKICSGIETLTDRRFSLSHLAQLKHILPEAIEMKRVLVFDEKLSVMKPDLQVTINEEAIQGENRSASETNNLILRKLFRSRLIDFHESHPEGDEVPEEELPEPFNWSWRSLESNVVKAPTLFSNLFSSSRLNEQSSAEQQSAVASHMSPFFRKRFSHKVMDKEIEPKSSDVGVSLLPSVVRVTHKISSDEEANSKSALSPIKLSPKQTITMDCASFTCPSATPTKEIDRTIDMKTWDLKGSNLESTPARLVLTPARLMASTPALSQEKRCYMSPNEVSINPTNKLVRRPARNKSLKFESPVKNEMAEDERDKMESELEDDDNFSILPKELWKSIKEKENKAMEERDPAISLAKRRRQMIASLPRLFNFIHMYFHSARRSVITKEELIHIVLAGHCAIVDRREVQEQLNFLLELVPEWISEKLASSGDLLVCINKLANAELIRSRLEEAK